MVAPTKRCTFDNVPEGATVSVANTASSGSAIATPNITGTGLCVAKADNAIRGPKGLECTGVSGDVFAVRLTQTAAASLSAQIYLLLNAAARPPSSSRCVARIRNASGNAAKLMLNSAGVLSIQNAAGSGIKNLYSNTALPDGLYVATLEVTKGSTSSNGRIGATVRSATTDALMTDCNYDSGTTVNAGTADLVEAQTGLPEALPGTCTFTIDDFAIVNSFNEIDRVVTPPIVTIEEHVYLVTPSSGTPPYTFDQTGGDAYTPTQIGSTGIYKIAQDSDSTRVYQVIDAGSLVTDSFEVPPIGTSAVDSDTGIIKAKPDLSGWDIPAP